MSSNKPLTVDSVRDYLLKNNGKVRNHDLVTHFRTQLNDPVNKAKVRVDFKEIIHQVSTVQTIEGEKYFVLKKNSASNLPPIPLRKPTRNVTQRKERAISGPPVNYNPRLGLNQNVPISQMDRSRSVGHSAELIRQNNIPEEENDSLRANTPELVRTVSADSGFTTATMETDSLSSDVETPKLSIRSKAAMFDRISSSSSLQSQISISDSASEADSAVPSSDDLAEDEYMVGSTVSLEPIEKDWMIACSMCNKAAMMCIMDQDPNIVNKKDFSMYTALHWAAKLGRNDIVTMLAGTGIDVNVRTNGGYTPLHLAVIHGHEDVIHTLVDDFEADINMRDYSGRKPVQLLKKDISAYTIAKLHGRRDVPPPSDFTNSPSTKKKHHGALNSLVLGTGFMGLPPADNQKDLGKDKKGSKKKSNKDKKQKKKEKPQIIHSSASEERDECTELKALQTQAVQEAEDQENSCSDTDMPAEDHEGEAQVVPDNAYAMDQYS